LDEKTADFVRFLSKIIMIKFTYLPEQGELVRGGGLLDDTGVR